MIVEANEAFLRGARTIPTAIDQNEQPGRRNPAGKALALLEWMAEAPDREFGVRELASALDWTPSTLHRILVLLENDGWLVSEPDTGRYRLGLRFLRAALVATREFPLWQTSFPFVQRLVKETDETVLLGLYDVTRLDVAFVSAIESSQPVRYVQDLEGARSPLHAGASGLAILANLPRHECLRVLAIRGMAAITEKTIVDRDELLGQLELVRERGYACTHGQRIPGAVGIAAPIFGIGGRVLGVVELTIPEFRFDRGREPDLAAAVTKCAQEISRQLEFNRPRPGPTNEDEGQ